MSAPTFEDVRAAAVRIAPFVPPTPVLRSAGIDAWIGTRVHLKAEHLHATGAFKLRGATNAVLQLTDDEAARGVVAHSSGNHASALARAATMRGVVATIVIPRGAPATKVAATVAAGGRIVECEPTMAARAEAVARLVAETGAVEIHPFDDPGVQVLGLQVHPRAHPRVDARRAQHRRGRHERRDASGRRPHVLERRPRARHPWSPTGGRSASLLVQFTRQFVGCGVTRGWRSWWSGRRGGCRPPR